MSKRTGNSLFMNSSHSRLYQYLLGKMVTIEEVGNHVTKEIRAAHAFRQTEKVRDLANILINLSAKEYQLIGQYYIVWADGRERRYNTESLETIIEQTATFKTKAMLSLAAFEGYQGRIDTSLY